MKKLFNYLKVFVVVMLVLPNIASAQQKSITIVNNTPHDIFFRLYGSTGECETDYRSSVWLDVASGSSVTYKDPNVVPGNLVNNMNFPLGPTGRFVSMRVAEDYPTFHCSNNVVTLSDCFKAYEASFNIYDGACNATSVVGTWTVTQQHAHVEFN